jgi:hypothetical protein
VLSDTCQNGDPALAHNAEKLRRWNCTQANEARRVPPCRECNLRSETLPPMLFPRADFQNVRFGQQASSSLMRRFFPAVAHFHALSGLYPLPPYGRCRPAPVSAHTGCRSRPFLLRPFPLSPFHSRQTPFRAQRRLPRFTYSLVCACSGLHPFAAHARSGLRSFRLQRRLRLPVAAVMSLIMVLMFVVTRNRISELEGPPPNDATCSMPRGTRNATNRVVTTDSRESESESERGR